jgi:hypothetical protein
MGRFFIVMLCGALGLACAAGSGCASVSSSNLMMKGAMWTAEQGVKKVARDHQEKKQWKASRAETPQTGGRGDRD